MCAMALLHRAKSVSNRNSLEGKSDCHQTEQVSAEHRMPAKFIGGLPSQEPTRDKSLANTVKSHPGSCSSSVILQFASLQN